MFTEPCALRFFLLRLSDTLRIELCKEVSRIYPDRPVFVSTLPHKSLYSYLNTNSLLPFSNTQPHIPFSGCGTASGCMQQCSFGRKHRFRCDEARPNNLSRPSPPAISKKKQENKKVCLFVRERRRTKTTA